MPNDPFYRSDTWKRIKAAVRKRSRGICEVPGCGKAAVVCDHIVSRRNGGADHPSQCRDLCREHDNQVKETNAATGARRNDGKPFVVGCDATGTPVDPGHWWNAKR